MKKDLNKNLKLQNDIIYYFVEVLKGKKFIIKTTFLFFILGILFLVIEKKTYEASSTFYPHYKEIDENSLKDLAGLAGINIGTDMTSEVPTTLYPNLISSSPFKKNVLDQFIYINEKKITYREYLINKKSSLIIRVFNQLIFYLKELFTSNIHEIKSNNRKTSDYIIITNNEFEIQKKLDQIINIEVNEKDGFIRLSVIEHDPYVAAQVAHITQELLQKSIIDFKIKNINSVYEFTISQLEESKKMFYKLQDSLAYFKDSNINIKSDIFKNQLNRIQSEMNIANSLYNELAINKERTAIDVKKNTPIFTIVDPVTLPIKESYPKKISTLIIFILSGLIFSILIVIYKKEIDNFKKVIINY